MAIFLRCRWCCFPWRWVGRRRKQAHGGHGVQLGGDVEQTVYTLADVQTRIQQLSFQLGLWSRALPAQPAALAAFGERMFAIASLEQDEGDPLTTHQLETLELALPHAISRSITHRRASRFTMGYMDLPPGAAHREMMSRLPLLITRSVEEEFATNAGGRFWDCYVYVAKSRASASYVFDTELGTPQVDALGRPVIFDEGHEGLDLDGFLRRGQTRDIDLNHAEIVVLRLYSWQMRDVWHAALCGDNDPAMCTTYGLGDWATCLGVLIGALARVSHATPLSNASPTVYRNLVEQRGDELPTPFLSQVGRTDHVECTISEPGMASALANVWEALSCSGGWDVPGTLLKIALPTDKNGRVLPGAAADLTFLSVHPRESEVVLAPFCMLHSSSVATPAMSERGRKRTVACEATSQMPPPTPALVDTPTAVPSADHAAQLFSAPGSESVDSGELHSTDAETLAARKFSPAAAGAKALVRAASRKAVLAQVESTLLLHTTTSAASTSGAASASCDVLLLEEPVARALPPVGTTLLREISELQARSIQASDPTAADRKASGPHETLQCSQSTGSLTVSGMTERCQMSDIPTMQVEAVVATLCERVGDEDAMRGCCGRVRDLSVEEEERVSLVRLGALDAIVVAMRQHPTAVGLLENACWAIKNLTAGEDSVACALKQQAIDADAFGAVVTAMSRHTSYSGVQEQGCSAIRNICYGSDAAGLARKQMCVEVLALPSICHSLRTHQSLPVLEQACGALIVLIARVDSEGCVRKQLAVQHGAPAALVLAMSVAKDAARAHVAEQACRALLSLCTGNDDGSKERKMATVDARCCIAIVSMMNAFRVSAGVVEVGYRAIRAICSGKDEHLKRRRRAATEAGILTSLVRGMQVHKKVSGVQQHGSKLLLVLCSSYPDDDASDLRTMAVDAGIMRTLIDGMTFFTSHGDTEAPAGKAEVVRSNGAALRLFTNSPALIDAARRAGAKQEWLLQLNMSISTRVNVSEDDRQDSARMPQSARVPKSARVLLSQVSSVGAAANSQLETRQVL